MSPQTEQATRLLCASVLTNRGAARDLVLAWVRDTRRAVAVELGLDLALTLKVARWAHRHADSVWRKYLFVCIAVALLVACDAPPVMALLTLLVAAFVWRQERLRMHEHLQLFTRKEFNPLRVARTFDGTLTGNDLDALPKANQNLFVYAGFDPFVGVGHDLGGWSVAVALDRAAKSRFHTESVEPVDGDDLYAAVDAAVDSLGLSTHEPQQCFFVRGTDVREHIQILPDALGRPRQTYSSNCEEHTDVRMVRDYRCYRVLGWNSELVFSYYLRCSLRGKALFVETKRFMLTPLSDTYRFVDGLRPLNRTDLAATAVSALIYGPVLALLSPLWWAQRLIAAGIESSSIVREARDNYIRNNPRHDYGANTSLRSSFASGAYAHYFQKLDGDFYNKLFDRTVLDSIVDLLDSRGIDTSSLREQQTAILNSGVIVQQGNVVADSIAVGTNSQVTKQVLGISGLRKHSAEKAAE